MKNTQVAKGIVIRQKQQSAAVILPQGSVREEHIEPEAITEEKLVSLVARRLIPRGAIIPFAGTSLPDGFLPVDGSAVGQVAFSDLFAELCPVLGAATITIASPAVVSLASHGLQTGSPVRFTTTGALPTGLSVDTDYFAILVTSGTFQLATTLANAIAAVPTPINTSVSQSGVHTVRFFPFNSGTASSTQFNVPDGRGRTFVGEGTYTDSVSGVLTRVRGQILGAERHVMSTLEMPAHHHSYQSQINAGNGPPSAGTFAGYNSSDSTGDTGGGTSHNNMQPSLVTRKLIKY